MALPAARSIQALGVEISVNDVCVFIPAVFGALASLFVYGIAKEVTKSPSTAFVSGQFWGWRCCDGLGSRSHVLLQPSILVHHRDYYF